MSKKEKHAATEWPKHLVYPCPGKCGHMHVKNTGPCTKSGCGCTATKSRKVK